MKNSLPAFTLAEITIALLISGVVSGMALFLYEKITFHTGNWWRFQDEAIRFKQAVNAMQNDAERADDLRLAREVLSLRLDGQVIYYTFDEGMVRQVSGVDADTLWPSVELIDFHTVQNTTLVDTLKLALSYKDHVLPLTIFKQYSFEQVINNLDADPAGAY